MRTVFILLISGLILSSCDSLKSTKDFGIVKKAILSNTWLLQDENGAVVSYNGENVSMEFAQEGSSYRASGFAGCNRYFSTVNLQPDQISFSAPGATLMACPEMEGEEAFLSLIPMVNNYEIAGNELKLYKDKILLLRFKSK